MNTLNNKDSRKLLLSINHLLNALEQNGMLSNSKSPDWLPQIIDHLGFVQIDPISAVEKAHYHILFSRNKNFKKEWLTASLEKDRSSFENWTHDAAILPMVTYPKWKHYFDRFKNLEIHKGYGKYFSPLTKKDLDYVLKYIEKEGACKPSEIPSKVIDWGDVYFPKTSLAKMGAEYLWRIGLLSITGRNSQTKVYDLAERVIPLSCQQKVISQNDFITWACRKALQQLGFARPAQMAHYMDAISKETALEWCRSNRDEVQEIKVEFFDHSISQPLFALRSVLEKIDTIPSPLKKLRLLNPFDPLIHDRKRMERIFGFDYKIEIWVPKSKRKFGYYVLPILEGDQFIGRIDLKTDRKSEKLNVLGLWWENGIKQTKSRVGNLNKELKSLSKFIGVGKVEW